jgi:hypothetical protein
MITKKAATLLTVIIGLFTMAPAQGQETGLRYTAATNWEKGEFLLKIEAPAARSGMNIPSAGLSAERRIQQELPRIFKEAVQGLTVDSRRQIRDILETDPRLGIDLHDAAMAGKKGLSSMSRDLAAVSATYAYPLYEVFGNYFVRHRRPAEVPRKLSWRPSAEFSGIIIYAKGELPVHGEGRSAKIVPCLFPEIFDEEMNPLLLPSMGDPEFLRRWGSAGYTASFDETPWEDRIGKTPLRIIATGLYGRYPASIKIPSDDAARILVNSKNRRLLAEGRVLIIRDPD